MDSEAPGIELRAIVDALRRRLWLILLCVVGAFAIAVGVSELQTRSYTATTSLLFANTQLSQQVAGLQAVTPATTQQSLQDTDVGLAEIGDMATKTAHLLHHGLTWRSVTDAVSVAAQGDTNLVTVSASSSSAQLAARIANTYSTIFVGEQQSADHAYYATALAAVQKQLGQLTPGERSGAQGVVLSDRAISLATLAALPSGDVQIAALARVPTSPSSPKVLRNGLVGALLGLLLGLALLLWVERSDQRLRDPAELESIFGLPLLGAVPESGALARAGRVPPPAIPPREAEAFQLIRGHLRYFNVDRKLRTLLVVSASPQAGKTTIAVHLALAAAEAGSRVALIDADLRRPRVADQLGLRRSPGLVDVLINAATIDEALNTIEFAPERDYGSHPLSVLTAGAVAPPNPTELLESEAMGALLEETANSYELVVIDSSPLLAVPDALALLTRIDGVIVVSRIGRDRRDEARRLRQVLEGAHSPVLGIVANALTARRAPAYGYGYDSGYTSGPGPVKTA
jgi:capsular exopolysaccharide synthesis family protein